MTQASVSTAQRQGEVRFVFKVQPRAGAARRLRRVARPEEIGDEQSLVSNAKSGNGDAFGELYKRHQQQAYGTALRILRNPQDAEDAVQRAFQRALINLRRFREDSSFATWLTRIVINDALMVLRQRRTQRPLTENSLDAAPGECAFQIADSGPTPLEILSEGERRATVQQAVSELRESLRVVMLHGELQGLTSAETARRLGLTVAAVKTRTFHARRLLRKRLSRSFERGIVQRNLQMRKA